MKGSSLRWIVAALLIALPAASACSVPLLPKGEVSLSPPSGDASKQLTDAVKKVKDGGTLTLAAGTYKISATLRILNSVHIVGAGAQETKIVGSGGDCVVEFNGGATITVEGVAFVRDGETPGDAADVVSAHVTFTDCGFAKAVPGDVGGGNGVAFFNDSTGTVDGCVATGNGRSGIHAQDRTSVTLTKNTCSLNGDAGIAFLGHAGGNAQGNTCEKNKYDGIHVQDSAAPALDRNKCLANLQAGILYLGEAGGTASQNRCTGNAGMGFSVGESATPELLANTVKGNPYGIAYHDSAAGVARGNICITKGTSNIGIAVFDNAHPKLIDNKSSVNITS